MRVAWTTEVGGELSSWVLDVASVVVRWFEAAEFGFLVGVGWLRDRVYVVLGFSITRNVCCAKESGATARRRDSVRSESDFIFAVSA